MALCKLTLITIFPLASVLIRQSRGSLQAYCEPRVSLVPGKRPGDEARLLLYSAAPKTLWELLAVYTLFRCVNLLGLIPKGQQKWVMVVTTPVNSPVHAGITADLFRRNLYASGCVPPEHFRGGTNPL